MTKIAIIGAGIGGLTTALACARLGLSVTLYERASVLAPLGASLSLWPNAMAVLDRLRLGDALRTDGAALSRVALREGGGRTLTDCDLSAINAKLGAGVCVPRAVLHDQLRQALPEGILQLGATLTGIAQTAHDVTLNFANGHRDTADLVIAADGVHSAIRAQLWGDGPAPYAGYCAALAIAQSTPKAVIPGEAAELYGPGGRLGLIPTGHGRCYWFFVRTMPSPGPHAAPITKAEMARWLAPWSDLMPDLDPDLVPDLLENTPEKAMVLAPIHDRRPTRQWGKGRVLLLGDALHPFTPNLGQGAGMAIEDGALLASLIACGTPPTALARPYRHFRASRVNAMARQARMIGQLAQWPGVWAPQLRRSVFGMASEAQMARRFEHQFTLPAATRKYLDEAGLVA